MTVVATSLALRWQRAQQIDRRAIQPLGQGPTRYRVQAVFNPGHKEVSR